MDFTGEQQEVFQPTIDHPKKSTFYYIIVALSTFIQQQVVEDANGTHYTSGFLSQQVRSSPSSEP